MTDSELDPLRAILAELAPRGRRALLPALHAAQRAYGWLPEAIVTEVARVLGLPRMKLRIIKKAIRIFNSTPQTDQAEAG